MHVCCRRLSLGVSVRACSLEFNPTETARIRDSVGNRADIHCPAASSSEVFQGLYRTNACPEYFDSFWPSSVSCFEEEWGNDCSYSWVRDLPLCKPDKAGGHAVVHGEWQATGLPRPGSPIQPPWPSSHPNVHPPPPHSDGSASAGDAFMASQWQSGSCRPTPIALQDVL